MTYWSSSRTAEGWVDILNGKWTPLVFLVLGAVAFVGQNYVSPIQCVFPSEFTPAMVEYGKARCYAARKITVLDRKMKDTDYIPTGSRDSDVERPLYQYVSLILILQAVFLRIPFMFWKLGERRLGIHFHVCTESISNDNRYLGKRLAVYLKNWIQNRHVHILSLGSFVIFHLFIKLLYFLSASTLLGLIDTFLKNEEKTSFGSQVLGNIDDNSILQTSPVFPRHMMCDYEVRNFGNKRSYTIQCTLPFNPYLEQVMAVVWWWLIFCIAATAADGFFYFFGAVLPYFRTQFVKSNLITQELGSSKQPVTEQNIQRFANDVLGEDIIDFLQQVQNNDNGCVVMETVTELWRIHYNDTHVPPVDESSLQPTTSRATVQSPSSHKEIGSGIQQGVASSEQIHKPSAPLIYPHFQGSS